MKTTFVTVTRQQRYISNNVGGSFTVTMLLDLLLQSITAETPLLLCTKNTHSLSSLTDIFHCSYTE